jgi:hypothetical protein
MGRIAGCVSLIVRFLFFGETWFLRNILGVGFFLERTNCTVFCQAIRVLQARRCLPGESLIAGMR